MREEPVMEVNKPRCWGGQPPPQRHMKGFPVKSLTPDPADACPPDPCPAATLGQVCPCSIKPDDLGLAASCRVLGATFTKGTDGKGHNLSLWSDLVVGACWVPLAAKAAWACWPPQFAGFEHSGVRGWCCR